LTIAIRVLGIGNEGMKGSHILLRPLIANLASDKIYYRIALDLRHPVGINNFCVTAILDLKQVLGREVCKEHTTDSLNMLESSQ
jgi:hypothetical protein